MHDARACNGDDDENDGGRVPRVRRRHARARNSTNTGTAGLGDAQGENGTCAEAKGRPRLRAATAAVDGGVPVRAAPGALETK